MVGSTGGFSAGVSLPKISAKSIKTLVSSHEALSFLERVWNIYVSSKARCYTIAWSAKGSLSYKHYCVEEMLGVGKCKAEGKHVILCGSLPDLFSILSKDLEKLLAWAAKHGYHVYFQVLPLAKKPDKGRGSASDIGIGRVLYADLDFKKSYNDLDNVPIPEEAKKVAEKQGYWYEELEGYALRAVYRDGNRWVYVERPKLNDILAKTKSMLGVKPHIVVDSGNGYHLYWILSEEVEASKLKPIEAKLVDLLGADKQSKDLARLLRLPGSINPRIHRPVRIIYEEPGEVSFESMLVLKKLKSITTSISSVPHKNSSSDGEGLRELKDSDIIKLKELLMPAYVPGFRHMLCLYLGGWAAWAKVSPISIAKVCSMLAEEAGDEELKDRLDAIVYSYKKLAIDISEYILKLEEIAGGKLHGASHSSKDKVKGKSGLQEILEQILGEEKALAILKELQEILRKASPFKDSVFELLDYEKQLYAVANLKRKIVATAQLIEKEGKKRFRYKARVLMAVPVAVEVYQNPLGGPRKFKVVFEDGVTGRSIVVGPATFEEVVARLRAEGVVYNKRILDDALAAILNAYIRTGRATIRESIDAPGFYWFNNKIIAVGYKAEPPGIEELRRALELLNELATKWFGHVIDKFATVVKWGLVAPFIYAMKQKGKWVPWLFLHGPSRTGKTTQGEMVLHIWGLGNQYRKSGANIDTVPRLGHVLSQGTFPVLVNEPGAAIIREDVIETMKNAIESTIVRGRYVRGSYIEIPSLAPLIITSNKPLLRDDALMRRFTVLHYTYDDRVPPNREEEFNAKVRPRLQELKALGRWFAAKVLLKPELLSMDWQELAEKLLAEAYEEVDMQSPEWINLRYNSPTLEELEQELVGEFRAKLLEYINNAYSRHVQRMIAVVQGDSGYKWVAVNPESVPLEKKIEVVVKNRLAPFMIPVKDDKIYITREIIDTLKIGVDSLKSLAAMLGWTYIDKKSFKIGKKTVNRAVTEISIEEFIQLLKGEEA